MLKKKLKIAMIACEKSGDHLGAWIINEVKAFLSKNNSEQKYQYEIYFYGVGGNEMLQAGFDSILPLSELTCIGIFEVISSIFRLLKIRKRIIKYILRDKPDIFIGIDAPDFNLHIEKVLKSHDLKVMHCVSPSVWAWRKSRTKKVCKATDRLFSILPFEKSFYPSEFNVDYVGHPFLKEIPKNIDRDLNKKILKEKLDIDWDYVIAVLPGSRLSEINQLSSTFLEAALLVQNKFYTEKKIKIGFVSAFACEETKKAFETILNVTKFSNLRLKTLMFSAREILKGADFAILGSGTITLEAMLCFCPMLVAYKVSRLTYAIFKKLCYIDCVSLPNILSIFMNEEKIVPEFLQNDCSVEKISNSLCEHLISFNKSKLQVEKYSKIIKWMEKDMENIGEIIVRYCLQ